MKKAIYDKLSSEDKKEYLRLNRVAHHVHNKVDSLKTKISFIERHPMELPEQKPDFLTDEQFLEMKKTVEEVKEALETYKKELPIALEETRKAWQTVAAKEKELTKKYSSLNEEEKTDYFPY